MDQRARLSRVLLPLLLLLIFLVVPAASQDGQDGGESPSSSIYEREFCILFNFWSSSSSSSVLLALLSYSGRIKTSPFTGRFCVYPIFLALSYSFQVRIVRV